MRSQLDHEGKTVFEADLPAGPEAFRNAIAPYRAGLVVGCECIFSWCWLADLCEGDEIPFTLCHALYMTAPQLRPLFICRRLPES